MFEFYSWKQFDNDIDILSSFVRPYISILDLKNIYGIQRGGLVVAVSLSHKLNLPIILEKRRITKKTIIVDDIIDSGNTMIKLLKETRNKTDFTLSLFFNQDSTYKSRYWVHKKNQNNWIVFPWETLNSSRYDN